MERRFSEEIESLKKRTMRRIVSGEATDLEQIFFRNLELHQQEYQERNNQYKEIVNRLKGLTEMIDPENADKTGVVTWKQVDKEGGFISYNDIKSGWGVFIALLGALPTIASILALYIANHS